MPTFYLARITISSVMYISFPFILTVSSCNPQSILLVSPDFSFYSIMNVINNFKISEERCDIAKLSIGLKPSTTIKTNYANAFTARPEASLTVRILYSKSRVGFTSKVFT